MQRRIYTIYQLHTSNDITRPHYFTPRYVVDNDKQYNNLPRWLAIEVSLLDAAMDDEGQAKLENIGQAYRAGEYNKYFLTKL